MALNFCCKGMVLKVFASMRFKNLPLTILQFFASKNKFLEFYFSNVHLRNFSKCVMGLDASLFDSVEVQKYLNFITNKNSSQFSPEVEKIINLLQEKEGIEQEIKTLENMSCDGDKEFEKLMISEKNQYFESIQEIKKKVLDCILINDSENDSRNIELHIVPGIGGEESKLFIQELFQMYINYAEFKNWECSAIDDKYIRINGNFVYGNLKHEAGVHRVQRVPETEKLGRTHTSTCSVVILPQPKPYEIQICEKDLIVEKIKSSGPGGQNVNKRETCVRIKHIPSGVVIENQTSRFQYENMKEAIFRLRGILFNAEQQKIMLERSSMRNEQIGTNDYSDKIRTYNYSQNRVTDHRLNYTTQNLKGFLSGNKELNYVIDQMKELNKKKQFFSFINNVLNSAEFKHFEEKQKRGGAVPLEFKSLKLKLLVPELVKIFAG